MTGTLPSSSKRRRRPATTANEGQPPKRRTVRRPKRRKRPLLRRKRVLLGLPLLTFAGLVALAPGSPLPGDSGAQVSYDNLGEAGGTFRYLPDDEVYAIDFDPRKVRVGLLEGWDREDDAFQDTAALAYVTGPMYERHLEPGGQEVTVPLGISSWANAFGKDATAPHRDNGPSSGSATTAAWISATGN